MAYAYANRSAVYFELGHYDKAITNIQKALENSYPEEKKKTLLDRKEKSEKLLHTINKMEEENVDDFFKLSYKPNPKYPSFADCIELRSNKKYGRYLVTNRDLKVGDIIAMEDFLYYSTKTLSEAGHENTDELMNYQVCGFCYKSNLLNLEPCKQCAHTMHCNEECFRNNLGQAHFLECHLMPLFIMKTTTHNVFRSFFTALSICNYSIDELKELIEETEAYAKPITVFDFDFSKMTQREKNKKLIQVMYCGHRIVKDNLTHAIEFAFTRNAIIAAMYEANREFIVKFITRLYEVQAQNCYEFSQGIPKLGSTTVCAGDCMCPGLTLFNHSCSPNVHRVVVGKKFALMVIRKVYEGEQLFDCYG
jgi:hypothetical protein